MRSVQKPVYTTLDAQASSLWISYSNSVAIGDSDVNAEEIKSPGIKLASSVTLIGGEQYGYAFMGIPVSNDLDEQAPTVALVASGPCGKVLLRSRARITYREGGKAFVVFAGSLIQYVHNIEEDSAIGMIVDDKWLMDKLRIQGIVRWKPETDSEPEKYWYDSGQPLIFNFEGFPDCVDSPSGVRFAPVHKYGYVSTSLTYQYAEPPVGAAVYKARSWTLADIMSYLSNIYSSSSGGSCPIVQGDNKIPELSRWVYFPDNCGTSFVGFTRTKKHFKLDGDTLLRAVSKTCRAAGPYDIYCESTGFRTKLKVINMNPAKSGAITLKLPSSFSSLSAVVSSPTAIKTGTITENIINYFDSVLITGEPPYCEALFSQYTEEDAPAIAGGLIQAWNQEDEDAFKAYVKANGKDKTAFEAACLIWPLVYAGYRVHPAYIPWKLTKWSSACNFSWPRIRPYQLTNEQGGSGDGSNPDSFTPMEIKIEYIEQLNPAPIWRAGDSEDGLALSPDRTVMFLPGLRKKMRTIYFHTDDKYNTDYWTSNPIRANLAVEAEFPITGRAGINGNGSQDPNATMHRLSRTEQFTYITAPEEQGFDYVEYLRDISSRPKGTKVVEPWLSENYPAKEIRGNELFTDRIDEKTGRLPRHAKVRLQDVKNIDYTGLLTTAIFNPALKPGVAVKILGKGINPRAVIKSVTLDVNKQDCQIELVSFDSSVIYDLPLAHAPTQEKAVAADQKALEKEEYGDQSSNTYAKGGKSATDPGMTESQQKKWDNAMKIYEKTDSRSDQRGDAVKSLLDAKAPIKKAPAPPRPEDEVE
jgi:hypothetical protein